MAERLECPPQMQQLDQAGAAPKKRPRESVRTTCEEENVILLAYTSLKLGCPTVTETTKPWRDVFMLWMLLRHLPT